MENEHTSRRAGPQPKNMLTNPKRFRPAFIVVIAALLMLAWSNRFIDDGAFVSFQAARNLVEGHGLYWDPGDPDGLRPSFLWTLVIAAGMKLGHDPAEFSMLAGMACLLGSLLVTWLLASHLFDSRGQALLAIIILGTNASFSAWTTGGQETALETLVAVAVVFAAAGIIDAPWPPPKIKLLVASLLMGIGPLVQIESIIFTGLAGVAIVYWVVRRAPSRAGRMQALVWVCVPFLAVAGVWIGWSLSYYGGIVPGRLGEPSLELTVRHGIYHAYSFLLSYWLIWLPFVLLPALPWIFAGKPSLRLVAAVVGMWVVFEMVSGGSRMEYRELMPALPFVSILIVWILFHYIQQPTVRHALLLLTFAGSLHHALTFHREGGIDRLGIQSVQELAAPVSAGEGDYVNIGRRLGRIFAREPVTIATSAVGAIPYYSRLATVPMGWGSNVDDLTGRGVNLILGEPLLVGREQIERGLAWSHYAHFEIYEILTKAHPQPVRVIYIPMNGDDFLEALYLAPNPVIENAIKTNRWMVRPVPARPF